ncbi:MAG: bifunctional demethylmenaquinone methyltransferase/2-methoxy-6-polyprenyl-1,4-benzoquinol methylase UbiE [Ekhidna sp.]|nr:bifunctional demethylmenaquinone methyltransferase/2-methoxy-6-polyprenyl-1,4-benzoquinol methylase UbiE [Ekhidna sp.]
MAVLPYKDNSETKKQQVAKMFDSISGKYDFLNHFLSLGIDRRWRKQAIRMLKNENPKQILDIATGTGDFAIESLKLNPEKVIGLDISEGMLNVGREKMKKKGIDHIIDMQSGDSENIHFENNSFDAVIVAFGVRNFEDLEKGLKEMNRVLKPGGKAIILEFSKPTIFPFKQLYNFYFRWILPKIGEIVSKDNAAYTYLPESVNEFPYGKEFLRILNKTGYKNNKCKPLTQGISSIYLGEK